MPKCDFCEKSFTADELTVDAFHNKWCSDCFFEALEEAIISIDCS